MALPTLTGTARLYADAELRFSPSGTAVAKIPLVFNSRRKNQETGEWEDADSLFITGTLFGERAEEAVEALSKGTEVLVQGRPRSRSWEDQDGNKRSTTELMIDGIAPTIRSQKPKAERGRGGFGQQGQQGGGFSQQPGPAGDPWTTGGGGFSDDAPPF